MEERVPIYAPFGVVPGGANARGSSQQCFTLIPVGEHARERQACYGSVECCREHDAGRRRTSAYIKAGKEEGNVGHCPSPKSKPQIHSSTLRRDFTMTFP